MAVVLALAGFLLIPVVLITAALVDNKLRLGWWFSRKWRTAMHAPLPFEQLSAADRDAWFGGDGGN